MKNEVPQDLIQDPLLYSIIIVNDFVPGRFNEDSSKSEDDRMID